MARKNTIIDTIIDSPSWKTFFSAVLPIMSGVLSGTFVTELIGSGGLNFKLFHKTWSFYGLTLLTIIIYLYNRALYLREKEISKFSDADFCVAYMRSKCLPEAAEKYKEIIRQGHGGELVQVMAELKEILK